MGFLFGVLLAVSAATPLVTRGAATAQSSSDAVPSSLSLPPSGLCGSLLAENLCGAVSGCEWRRFIPKADAPLSPPPAAAAAAAVPPPPPPQLSSASGYACFSKTDDQQNEQKGEADKEKRHGVNATELEDLLRTVNGAAGHGPEEAERAAEAVARLLLGGAPADGSTLSSRNVSLSSSGVVVAVSQFAANTSERAIAVEGGSGRGSSSAKIPASFFRKWNKTSSGSSSGPNANSTAADGANSTETAGLVAAHIPFGQQLTASPPPTGARFSSDVITFDVYKNGQRMNVSNLTEEPIELRIACNHSRVRQHGDNRTVVIKYWDEARREWRGDGIVDTACKNATASDTTTAATATATATINTAEDEDGYACATTSHLTAFAVFEVSAGGSVEATSTTAPWKGAAAAPACAIASLLCVVVASLALSF